jgi:hypothetical protein
MTRAGQEMTGKRAVEYDQRTGAQVQGWWRSFGEANCSGWSFHPLDLFRPPLSRCGSQQCSTQSQTDGVTPPALALFRIAQPHWLT